MIENTNTLIVIPARYGSTRFPGKPLAMIAGASLLQRVSAIAKQAAAQIPGVGILIATDDERIMQHAATLDIPAVMTPQACATGTDRALAAIKQLKSLPEYVINLQGDAPLTPVSVIIDLINALQAKQIVTPVMQLSWSELDVLRKTKETNLFSGTTAIVNKNREAVWFSKQIIPAIRAEKQLRLTNAKSPVYQHLGIYAYRTDILEAFAKLPISYYEQLEGLEQLRLIENGYTITAMPVQPANLYAWRGVDTIDDANFVEQLILGNI